MSRNIIRPSFLLQKYIQLRHSSCISSKSQDQQIIERLKNKSLIKVSGKDASEFLQGLMTNDIRIFKEGSAASMYTLFLNTKGRVLFDTILYTTQEKDTFYIECDASVTVQFQKHLKMYKLRRNVDIEHLKDDSKIWVLFDSSRTYDQNKINNSKLREFTLEGQIFPCSLQINSNLKSSDNKSNEFEECSKIIEDGKILVYKDPRLVDLGLRILSRSSIESVEIIKHLGINNIIHNVKDTTKSMTAVLSYKTFRYKLGIGEGVEDFLVGKALPLEINSDYLHGISFHKGCYIGQELTARTYHTGVVRKRFMPLLFREIPQQNFQYDDKIDDESGKVVGRFRGQDNCFGLGLMRISEALSAQHLNIKNLPLQIIKPSWWPRETQKHEFIHEQ